MAKRGSFGELTNDQENESEQVPIHSPDDYLYDPRWALAKLSPPGLIEQPK